MFDIKYSNQSLKFLKKLEGVSKKRIIEKIEQLRIEPFPQDVKKVEGVRLKLFRVRVGVYRILYEVDHKDDLLGIVRLDKRPRAYGKF